MNKKYLEEKLAESTPEGGDRTHLLHKRYGQQMTELKYVILREVEKVLDRKLSSIEQLLIQGAIDTGFQRGLEEGRKEVKQ